MGGQGKTFVFGDLSFDWINVFKENKRLKLSQLERRILEYVVVRRPSEVSGVVIATHLYGRTPSEYDIRSFWTTLCNLRRKLRVENTVVTIETRDTGGMKKGYAAGLLS